MCGRYTLTTDPAALAEHFDLTEVPADLPPHYNIAPTQQVPIVRQVEGLGRRLDRVHWGLIPSWAKDPSMGNRMINARAETLAERPAFRAAFRHRRCLVAADGFYEWKPIDGNKQPYWIGLQDRRPLAFAGLWEHWDARDGSDTVESCTIVTTDADTVVRPLHERMPVILRPEDYDAWLDPQAKPDALQHLLTPFESEELVAYPVSRAVNNPRNDNPDLLLPVNRDD